MEILLPRNLKMEVIDIDHVNRVILFKEVEA